MKRDGLAAAALLFAAGCATAPATRSPATEATPTRVATPVPPRPVNRAAVRTAFCGTGTDPRTGFDDLLACGDLLADDGKIAEATGRWKSALPAAKTREEQCAAIERIRQRSLDPDAALASVSPTIIGDCKERTAQSHEDERAKRAVRAQRATCLAQCDAIATKCFQPYSPIHCEDDVKRCRARCE